MPAARDHKRIGESDTGPNTGGMGTITDPSVLDQATLDIAIERIVEPTLHGARAEGFPFRGILFIGLMLTEAGPQVLEYNVRFGDPETQAILVRLETDLVDVFEAICDQRLDQVEVEWSNDSSVCIVLAAPGYPGKVTTGAPIDGLDRASQKEDVVIFHAATSRDESGNWLTAGGRVLGVTATGTNLEAALNRAYAAAREIRWPGMQYRRDIGRPVMPKAASGS
jgi:phosphoribosylamine--glycine ligase